MGSSVEEPYRKLKGRKMGEGEGEREGRGRGMEGGEEGGGRGGEGHTVCGISELLTSDVLNKISLFEFRINTA